MIIVVMFMVIIVTVLFVMMINGIWLVIMILNLINRIVIISSCRMVMIIMMPDHDYVCQCGHCYGYLIVIMTKMIMIAFVIVAILDYVNFSPLYCRGLRTTHSGMALLDAVMTDVCLSIEDILAAKEKFV